jgi:diguanylate cyclase (GGDEF)-like protein/PAS domain S-box-containing protein
MSDDLAGDHEALLQFLYMAPVGLVQTSMDGEIVMINPKSAQLLMPLQQQGILSNLFEATEMVAPELRNMVASFGAPSGMICNDVRFQVTAGIRGKVDPQILAITLLKLDAQRLMAVISDVSLSVKREQQLNRSEAWFNAILAGVTDYALIPLDRNGIIDNWNSSIGRLTGLTADEVVGKPYSALFPETAASKDRMLDYLREADESGWSLHEGWCLKADGSKFWGCNMIAPLDPMSSAALHTAVGMPEWQGYALIIRDITDRRATGADLLRASMSDHLTGILNRRGFFDEAELELKRWHRNPRPLSLLAIDADHFKQINDTLGHAAGDTVLQHLAETITRSAREIDIVARVGGEEFAVLLPSTALAAALAVAERIRKNVESTAIDIDGREVRYTVSIGVSTMCEGVSGMDDMMKMADKALYDAKRNGRNRIYVAGKPDTP